MTCSLYSVDSLADNLGICVQSSFTDVQAGLSVDVFSESILHPVLLSSMTCIYFLSFSIVTAYFLNEVPMSGCLERRTNLFKVYSIASTCSDSNAFIKRVVLCISGHRVCTGLGKRTNVYVSLRDSA